MSVERECFALAMCLRQPVFVLKTQAFFLELWAQVLADASVFVVLVGGFVAWTLSSEIWTTGMDLESPIYNDGHTKSTTSLPSAPKATAPVVEADFQEVQRGIQQQTRRLERVTSIQSTPEDVYLPTLTEGGALSRSPLRNWRHPRARNPVITG
jgi:hypothetical protein